MAAAIASTHPATLTAVRRTNQRRPVLRAVPAVAPTLSVIIVNYCQWHNTSRLTEQLRQSHAARAGDAEIIVLDNHSPNHPLRGRLHQSRNVCVQRFGSNRGFARAVNSGCRLSDGEWILLLNPDVSVPAGFLDEVEAFAHRQFRTNRRVGIIGLNVRNEDGTTQPSCGPMPSFANTLAGLLRPRSRRKCRPVQAEAQVEVPWATGCALLIRRECLDDIGGFDERFFLYYEDVDLCRRATECGWKICFEPTLQVIHHTPLHDRRVPPPLRMMTRHALVTYGKKHWPWWQTLLLGGFVVAETSVRQTLATCAGRPEDARFHAETRRLVIDVLHGRARQARARIREAADSLALAAAAQDCRTC